MKEQVAILMSTYNGASYLKQQIDSIIKQTNSTWHLYIRDDGSTDNTAEIIAEYADKYPNITFFNKNNITNIGITKSFMTLLRNVDADYYMFCDQDDIWNEDKIQISLQTLLNNNVQNSPACLFTELQVVDRHLHPLTLMNNKNIWFDFIHFLFGNCVTGCTMMINQPLKDILRIDDTKLNQIYLHDWWIALVAAAFGKLIYINKPTIKYRQHGSNVEGSKRDNLFTLLQRAINLEGDQEGLIRIFKMDKEFNRLFGNQITGKNKAYLESYSSLFTTGSFLNNLKLLISLPPKRAHLKGDILFSYLILFHYKEILKSGN